MSPSLALIEANRPVSLADGAAAQICFVAGLMGPAASIVSSARERANRGS